jgi:ribosomal protein S13
MSSYEQEIRNQQFQNATGTAPTFRSIDGVGEKTAQKVKGAFLDGGKGRIEAPRDVQDLTDEELAETTGITKNRARKVIKGAGGNPDRDETRSTTGSVSAAGIKMPHGEFVTEVSEHDNADAKFSMSRNKGIGRSQEAAIADKAKRAPVTTDYEKWKNNKGKYDFPGVDTPTTDPQVLPKDLRQEQRPNTTDPDTADVTPAASVQETPSNERNTTAPDPFALDLGQQDVSLAPEEAFEGVATESYDGFSGVGSRTDEQRRLEEGEPPEQALQEQQQTMGGGAVGDLVQGDTGDTPAGVARREGERQAAQSEQKTPGLQLLDSRIRAARGDELDTSDAKYGAEEKEELASLFK